jgi:hypothetical protein
VLDGWFRLGCRLLNRSFEFASWQSEVVDIDGRRVDKVLAQPVRKPMVAR